MLPTKIHTILARRLLDPCHVLAVHRDDCGRFVLNMQLIKRLGQADDVELFLLAGVVDLRNIEVAIVLHRTSFGRARVDHRDVDFARRGWRVAG